MNTINLLPRRSAVALAAAALAATLGAGGLTSPARAAESAAAPAAQATAATAPTDAKTDAATKALLAFSRAGQDAIDNVRLARMDLFDGHTDQAMKDMKTAQKALMQAKAEAPSFDTSTKVEVQGKVVGVDKDKLKADLVPVDGDLVLTDRMQLSAKHQPFLDKARALLHMGDKAGAAKALKEGDIAVSYQRRWIPIGDAGQQLDRAIELATQKKYYEANLALKTLEDHVQTDTVAFDLPPAGTPAS